MTISRAAMSEDSQQCSPVNPSIPEAVHNRKMTDDEVEQFVQSLRTSLQETYGPEGQGRLEAYLRGTRLGLKVFYQ